MAISGGISDIFGAVGDVKEANAYDTAALFATQNAQIEKESTAIQQAQLSRKIFQTLGAQTADVAGGGFRQSGSAIDVFRNSAQQGSLAHQLVATQGAINENSYLAAAAQYKGMAGAARAAAVGNSVGGILQIFGL